MPIQKNDDVPLDNKQLRVYDNDGSFTRYSVDEVIAKELNSWKGWACSAGVRNQYIDYDGNIWIANCASIHVHRFNDEGWKKVVENWLAKNGNDKRRYHEIRPKLLKEFELSGNGFRSYIPIEEGLKHWPGYLGNIYEGMDIPDEWTICEYDRCGCGADVVLSKSRTFRHQNLLKVTNNGFSESGNMKNYVEHDVKTPSGIELNFPVPYQILWDISRRCNYDCNYCWPAVHNNKEEFPSYETVIKTIDMMIDHWSNGEPIRWNFGGGEPTMHPRFLDILKHLKSRNQWVLVTTNGSRSTKFWREAVKYINSVNMSAHFASMDLFPGNEDRFVENCRIIMEHHDAVDDDHWLEIKLMTPPGYLERAQATRKRIEDLGMLHLEGANGRPKGTLSLVPIRSIEESNKVVKYTHEELQYFTDQE